MKRWGLLLLLTGCGHVCVEEEMVQLQERVWERTGYCLFRGEGRDECRDAMSIDDLVSLALQDSPELAARIEDLGVAKADLVQAGLLSNPSWSWDWRLPSGRSSIEGALLFPLADLWQRPLRRRAASFAAEETAHRVLEAVLDLVALARHAAMEWQFAGSVLSLHEGHLLDEMERSKRIDERQAFGLESDWESYLAQAAVGQVEIHLAESRLQLRSAASHMREVLGWGADAALPVIVEERVPQVTWGLDELVQLALSCRPDLVALHLSVERAEAALRLEKSRFIRELDFGLSYVKDPGETSGFGPGWAIQLPIFDQNNAQIARARFLLCQAQEQLRAAEVAAQAQVSDAYAQYEVALERAALIQERVNPALLRAWAYAERFGETMQLNLLFQLDARMRLEEARVQELESLRDAYLAFVDLERAVSVPLRR